MWKTVAIILLAGSLVCGVVADSCYDNLKDNVFLSGGDLEPANARSTRDAVDCCLQCIDVPECMAFSWNKVTGACSLKGTNVGKAIRRNGFVSKQVIPRKCFGGYRVNHDIQGVLMRSFPEPGADFCCKACTETPGCVAMTYDDRYGRCDLFNRYSRFVYDGSGSQLISKTLKTSRRPERD